MVRQLTCGNKTEGKMDEQTDTLGWFSGVRYLITAVGNNSAVVCTGQLIGLLSEDLKKHVAVWTQYVRTLERLNV